MQRVIMIKILEKLNIFLDKKIGFLFNYYLRTFLWHVDCLSVHRQFLFNDRLIFLLLLLLL